MALYAIDRVNWSDGSLPQTRHERKYHPDRDEDLRAFAGENDIAVHWDGTYRDGVSFLPGEFWTDSDYECSDGEGGFLMPKHPREFAKHLAPN